MFRREYKVVPSSRLLECVVHLGSRMKDGEKKREKQNEMKCERLCRAIIFSYA